MKGVNLKKIGAIVAGATILASSVAFAGLMYGNTVLVDDNGQPVAKVVLGSGAAPSDGVVAGAIAAKIASAAYKKTTLTAAVPNDATCTGTASGSGTCAISNEKVTLEITVPGATSEGVHAFTTLIGDYIDKKLENRVNTGDEDKYLLTVSENSDNANPFDLGTNSIISEEDLYRVSASSFAPFEGSDITDPQTGDEYTETQAAWIQGTTEYVEADAAVEFKPTLMAYSIKFDSTDNTGIPVCTNDDTTASDFADCTDSDSEFTGRHRVKIDFLGAQWVITDMDEGTNTVTTTSDAVSSGGSVTLAKESVYGIVNVGESIETSDKQLSIRLDDISTPVGSDQEAPAIVSFVDANGNVVSQDQVDPGDTVEKTIGGKTYKIKVYQTAPGYTFGAKWAEMALIENELELTDGETVDDEDNEDWNVELVWKNKEAGTTAALDDADTLRGIVLYRESFTFTGDNVAVVAGESINVVEDPVAYKLTYKGLDLADDEYDTLKYQKGSGSNVDLGTFTVTLGDYVKVTSGSDTAFENSDGQGDTLYYVGLGTFDVIDGMLDMDENGSAGSEDDGYITTAAGTVYKIVDGYVDVDGDGTTAEAADNATDISLYNGSADQMDIIAGKLDVDENGTIVSVDDAADVRNELTNSVLTSTNAVLLIKETSTSNEYVVSDTFTAATTADYTNAGELGTTTDGGVIGFTPDADGVGIKLYEDVGQIGTDEHTIATLGIQWDNAASQFESDLNGGLAAGGADDSVNYNETSDVPSYTDGAYEEGEFISPRGSTFDDIGSTSVTFSVATRVGLAQYEFATSEAAETGASTTQVTLGEGESTTVEDVTVKVKSIDETVGACAATGGSATCTVSKDTIEAVIMPQNKASVDAVVPYSVDPKLVVLDKDAAAVTTGVLITVGGDKVNSVTADAIAGSDVDFTATTVVVRAFNNKIVVAGLTAEDTVAAGNEFLANVKSN